MKCDITGKEAEYQICVTKFNKRKPSNVVGYVCADKVQKAIDNVMTKTFGTTLWPTVHDLKGNLLYHSYDADQRGVAAAAGWVEYIENQRKAN